jgi:hypothetical protein
MMFESTNRVPATINERSVRRALIIIAFAGLSAGLAAAFTGRNEACAVDLGGSSR